MVLNFTKQLLSLAFIILLVGVNISTAQTEKKQVPNTEKTKPSNQYPAAASKKQSFASPQKSTVPSNENVKNKVLLPTTTEKSSSSVKNTTDKKKTVVTGIWQGHFLQREFDPLMGTFITDRYKYEVQLNNLPTNALEGVTYSYQTTRFYGKAALNGIFTSNTNNLVIKETKMLELKVTGNSEACLMTCYLDYKKEGNKEILQGEYTSQNLKTKKPCGDGTVYLVKVPESDFTKEDFLEKQPESSKPITPPVTKNNNITPKNITAATPKLKFKPGAEDNLVKKEIETKPKQEQPKIIEQKQLSTPTVPQTEKVEKLQLPKVLRDRNNNLVKTFFVDEGEINIELYDNGEIDNDTVSVYHNGEPVILNGRLSTRPLTVKINISAQNPVHELVMVAENLGKIPPNTSLMYVRAGKKTYQAFITSDLQKNAKIIFEYKPGANDIRK